MRLSWKMGRVAGIDLYIHATFLLVFLFPQVLHGGPGAVLRVLSLFGCVLLHELGHALMARRYGIQTADITLYPIGGVARLERMPRAPGAELLIALAGPAVNFAIAAALFVLMSLPLFPAGSTATFAVGDYLTDLLGLNMALGIFNLIPAFPMDGGRVLRALLSGWLGRVHATQIAARIGRGLALLFGIVVPFWTGNPIHVLLAAFIYFAASAEEAQVVREERGRQFDGAGDGVWVAPPGYRWVHRGGGIWQLAPLRVTVPDPQHDASRWL